MQEQGYLAIVLHAHLPFVRHPEYNDFLEEDWLYEAITETYLPLIDVFERLVEDRVPFRVSMVVTPSLAAMLSDALLRGRYVRHLDRLIELSEKEIARTHGDSRFEPLARMYREHFLRCRWQFQDRYGRDILGALRRLQDHGELEILTCAATHGFLPLLQHQPEAVRAQIRVGAEEYARHFGRRPRGIWLPECAYYPGIDRYLADENIRYFLTDAHGVAHATPRPRFGVYAPIYCPSGVAAFARDIESSKQVWSSKEGYPGDFSYREFYRDVGWDLDYEYVRPYIQPTGARKNTGIKYYRITGEGNYKEPYEPDRAREAAAVHAGNFVFNRGLQIQHLAGTLGRAPIVVSPYDAELYGHWWWEGPRFLDYVIRKTAYDQRIVRLCSLSEYLRDNPTQQMCQPSVSSWGNKGYNEVWLNDGTDWIYRHLHMAAERMIWLARTFKDTRDRLVERALNQAARELLLAQSSDWPFLMTTGTARDYASKRVKDHVLRFTRLFFAVKDSRIDEGWLRSIEERDNLFPNVDFRLYV